METKICSKCKRELPATTQYFHKEKRSKDGFKSSCKECRGGNFKEKEKLPEGYRRCSNCKSIFPETKEFFNMRYRSETKRYHFICYCVKCGKNRLKKWREENNERVKEGNRKYRKNNRDIIREYETQYRKEHPEYSRTKRQKRMAKNKLLDCNFTPEQWERAKAFFDYKCSYCGKKTEKLEQDHVVPISKGGPYTTSNIVPACKSCNSSKSNKDMEQWYKEQPFYSQEREQRIKEYLSHMATPR